MLSCQEPFALLFVQNPTLLVPGDTPNNKGVEYSVHATVGCFVCSDFRHPFSIIDDAVNPLANVCFLLSLTVPSCPILVCTENSVVPENG